MYKYVKNNQLRTKITFETSDEKEQPANRYTSNLYYSYFMLHNTINISVVYFVHISYQNRHFIIINIIPF